MEKQRVTLMSSKDGRVLLGSVVIASGFIDKLTGLLGRQSIEVDEAMLLCPCSSVHTIAMRFTIDVVFLNSKFEIVKLVSGLKPNRMAGSSKARQVLEIAEGQIAVLELKIGQQMCLGKR